MACPRLRSSRLLAVAAVVAGALVFARKAVLAGICKTVVACRKSAGGMRNLTRFAIEHFPVPTP